MLPAAGEETADRKPSRDSKPDTALPEGIRSAEFLRRARAEKYLPKAPAIRIVNGVADVSVSSMPLEERLRRGIVPRRGFCSVAPAADAVFISGNDHMNLEMLCDPHSEEKPGGNFNFDNVFTAQNTAKPGTTGNALASFELGYSANGSLVQVSPSVYQRLYHQGYFGQDTWQVTNKLTATLARVTCRRSLLLPSMRIEKKSNTPRGNN